MPAADFGLMKEGRPDRGSDGAGEAQGVVETLVQACGGERSRSTKVYKLPATERAVRELEVVACSRCRKTLHLDPRFLIAKAAKISQ